MYICKISVECYDVDDDDVVFFDHFPTSMTDSVNGNLEKSNENQSKNPPNIFRVYGHDHDNPVCNHMAIHCQSKIRGAYERSSICM